MIKAGRSLMHVLSPSWIIFALSAFSTIWFVLSSDSRRSIEGRYSFSLTTFDPSGKLGQVARAGEAAALGTPVVAICVAGTGMNGCIMNSIVMASPQILPSALYEDDGTSRFCKINENIIVAHSGLSADGRVLVAAAQRLAVQHEYAYDEPIPIHIFLEEVSLLFQEYTMKPAARPFGVTLLVGHVSETNTLSADRPQLYRIDPSGAVQSLGDSYAIVNGGYLLETNAEFKDALKNLAKAYPSAGTTTQTTAEATLGNPSATAPDIDGNADTSTSTSKERDGVYTMTNIDVYSSSSAGISSFLDNIRGSLVKSLETALQKSSSSDQEGIETYRNPTILTASLSNQDVNFVRRRYDYFDQ